MSVEKEIQARSGSKCELCGATDELKIYEVPPKYNVKSAADCVHICDKCLVQIEDPEKMEVNHWHCLNESMWSQVPAVQVMAWRMLHRLSSEIWSHDLLDMLYLDEDTLAWAQSTGEGPISDDSVKHIDSNGLILQGGDTVVLIKDLDVRGAGFTAKRGTPVRGITLVANNPEHIEGKVNGQQIVILTKFVKKSI